MEKSMVWLKIKRKIKQNKNKIKSQKSDIAAIECQLLSFTTMALIYAFRFYQILIYVHRMLITFK